MRSPFVAPLSLLLCLAGCAAPAPRGAGPDSAPADFALVFTVTPAPQAEHAPDTPPDPDPLARPAQHIVTPDRVLRVAFGAGVTPGLFPRATATLTPAQIDALWRAVRDHRLVAPQPPATTGPTYTIDLTVHGRQTRATTSADASPGAREVLRVLATLRGDPVSPPNHAGRENP